MKRHREAHHLVGSMRFFVAAHFTFPCTARLDGNAMKPLLRAIVWNDWPASACAVAIPIMWAIYFVFPVLNPGAIVDGCTLLLPATASLICTGLLAWRVRRVNALFEHGIETAGEILAANIIGDRGRLEYAYQWNDGVFFSWIPVHKAKRFLGSSHRQAVPVLVDPTSPKRSIVRELFL